MKNSITRKHAGKDVIIGRLSARLVDNDDYIGETVLFFEVFNQKKGLNQTELDTFIFRFNPKTFKFMLDKELQFLSLKRPPELTKIYKEINQLFTLGIDITEFIDVISNEYVKGYHS